MSAILYPSQYVKVIGHCHEDHQEGSDGNGANVLSICDE